MKTLSLNGSEWALTCYWRHQWRLRRQGRQEPHLHSALPSVPAVVPGAVHEDLRRAGLVPDWNVGLHSLACEWINNRDWAFTRRIVLPPEFDGQLTLEFDGLDYAGHVAIDGNVIGEFEGTHLRHEFDVTGRVAPGRPAELEVMVYASPEVDGVVGFTSRTRIFKPRFGYCWDWCPRLVNIGIWQDVRIVSRGTGRLRGLRVRASLLDATTGRVTINAAVEGQAAMLRYVLRDDEDRLVAEGEAAVAGGAIDHQVDVPRVRLWWPATHGDQPLYRLRLDLIDAQDRLSDRCTRTIGFRRIRWLNNPSAPPNARPYLCEINGRSMFLRGVNWVPLSPFYGSVGAERYEAMLRLYRNMNANVLRVWGGGILERPEFFDLCDRLGLLVWQEFPLSSSGIDNWPPEAPEVIASLRRIAEEYILRRGHHASHLLWCGGNELQGAIDGEKVGIGKPVDETHPCMRMFAEVVNRLDPGKRFLVTSPSGPRFFAAAEDFGKGLHHQTHGPWGNLPLAERYAYFNGDDSLFRSETGAPGCESLESIERNRGDQQSWPPRPENPYWLHPASAWIPWRDVSREFGPFADHESELPFVVRASRYIQAESYRYAAEAARRRAPKCSGFIVWMGHDAAHCTANNSIIEQTGWPKPAYAWLQQAFAGLHVSLKHDAIVYVPGRRLTGQVWVHRNAGPAEALGHVTARLLSICGDVFETTEFAARLQAGDESACCGDVDWTVPHAPHELLIVDLAFELADRRAGNRYLLSQSSQYPLAPLRALQPAKLSVGARKAVGKRRRRVTVVNKGSVCAVAVELCARSPAWTLITDRNNLILLPGEAATIEYEATPSHFAAGRRSRDARLRLEWFNMKAPLSLG